MRKNKREREITLLYGMSLIRDDVLNHPVYKPTFKDKLIEFIYHALHIIAAVIVAVVSIGFLVISSNYL